MDSKAQEFMVGCTISCPGCCQLHCLPAFDSLFLRQAIERQGGAGGLMTIGKSKARVYGETAIKVTFADVAGVDAARAELQNKVAVLLGSRAAQ